MDFAAVWNEEVDEKEGDFIKGRQKSPEEINKFAVLPDGTDMERALAILKSGQQVQQLSVYSNTHMYLDNDDPDGSFKKLLPYIKSSFTKVKAGENESTIGLVQSLCMAVVNAKEKKLRVDVKEVAGQLIPLITKALPSCTENAICEPMGDLLYLLVPPSEMMTQIPFIVSMAESSNPEARKLMACKLMGRVCADKAITPTQFVDKVLDRCLKVCQDTAHQVRITACRQLVTIINYLPTKVFTDKILPEVLELLLDEEKYVKAAAWEVAVEVMGHMTSESVIAKIMPPLVAVTVSENQQLVLETVALRVGVALQKMIETLRIPVAELAPLLLFYKTLPGRSKHCKYCCAYNYPAVLTYVGPSSLTSDGYKEIWDVLIADSDEKVKSSLSSGFFSVIKLFPPEKAVEHFGPSFVKLLSDSSITVRDCLIEYNLDSILAHFNSIHPKDAAAVTAKNACFNEALVQLCLYGGAVKDSWRHQVTFLQGMANCSKYFDNDKINKLLVPILFDYLISSAPIVRNEAVRNICRVLQPITKLSIRRDIINRIKNDFAYSATFHDRIVFANFIRHSFTFFSWKYIRSYFQDIIVDKLSDKVPAVQLAVLPILPYLVRSFIHPADDLLKEKIEAAVVEISKVSGNYTLSLEASMTLSKLKEVMLKPNFQPRTIEEREELEANKQLEVFEATLPPDDDKTKSAQKKSVGDLPPAVKSSSVLRQSQQIDFSLFDDDKPSKGSASDKHDKSPSKLPSIKSSKESSVKDGARKVDDKKGDKKGDMAPSGSTSSISSASSGKSDSSKSIETLQPSRPGAGGKAKAGAGPSPRNSDKKT